MTRKRNELPVEQQAVVARFISKHLNPPPGRTPQDVKSRLLHWISVANNPSVLTSETNAKVLANMRRKARQNIRRLVLQHPDVASQIPATEQPEVSR
jgi:hypothetical protein